MDSSPKPLLDSYETPAEQLEVFGRLDELASANLQTFIKELVGILADTGELSHRRIGAAKEIKRHLSSECRFVSDMQKQEWFNVPQIERISIQNKLMNVLERLDLPDLIDPLAEAFTAVIVLDNDENKTGFEMVAVNFPRFTDYGKIVGITIIDGILTLEPDLFSRFQDHLVIALKSSLIEATNLTREDLSNKRFYVALLCYTHHLGISPDEFVESIVQIIEEQKLLESADEDISIAAIDLLTKAVNQMKEGERSQQDCKAYWEEVLKKKDDGIYIRLVVKKLQMKSVSIAIAIDKFYRAVESI